MNIDDLIKELQKMRDNLGINSLVKVKITHREWKAGNYGLSTFEYIDPQYLRELDEHRD